jgi:hypothetical protein
MAIRPYFEKEVGQGEIARPLVEVASRHSGRTSPSGKRLAMAIERVEAPTRSWVGPLDLRLVWAQRNLNKPRSKHSELQAVCAGIPTTPPQFSDYERLRRCSSESFLAHFFPERSGARSHVFCFGPPFCSVSKWMHQFCVWFGDFVLCP